jgi:hypothetical protein
MGLVLTLNEISVEFVRFLGTNYPRTPTRGSKVEYSIARTPSLDGPVYPITHIWACNAIYTREQRDLIEELYDEFHYRRSNQMDCDILIWDTTATFKERAPRTRAIVPDAVEQPGSTGRIKYFAQFKAAFEGELKFDRAGQHDFVNFTLTETVLVLP